ncbi:MAG: hypothetical protein E7391_03030 [Ruminococcaceae bacterium]|nr:hypothetical protein [Oscillospiraceae bacterium]
MDSSIERGILMRIMTANIWGDYFNNPVMPRKNAIVNLFKKFSPDIIGLQEINPSWFNADIPSAVKDEYTVVGNIVSNYVPLYYKTEKFSILEFGWERYEKTEDKSKGITWALLVEKETEKKIAVLNTHLWWKQGSEHDALRVINAKQLFAKMKYLKEKYSCPVFAFGDFNAIDGSDALNYLEKNGVFTSYKFADSFSKISSHHGDPENLGNGIFKGKETLNPKEKSLDHIVTFKDEIKIKKHDLAIYQEILDATDHSPVYIDFDL